MNESCLVYEWVMSHMWMSHVSYMNESCLMHEWVTSHIWMSHVAYMNESYLILFYVYNSTPHAFANPTMSHVTLICVSYQWHTSDLIPRLQSHVSLLIQVFHEGGHTQLRLLLMTYIWSYFTSTIPPHVSLLIQVLYEGGHAHFCRAVGSRLPCSTFVRLGRRRWVEGGRGWGEGDFLWRI